jgi:hypothetical protein
MTRQRVKGLSLLVFLAATLFVLAGFGPSSDRAWMQRMAGAAGTESVLGFLLISGALERSDRFFYSVFAGEILVRLLLLGLFAALFNRLSVSAAAPLLTLVFTFFVCSLAQMPFLSRSIHEFHRDPRASSS